MPAAWWLAGTVVALATGIALLVFMTPGKATTDGAPPLTAWLHALTAAAAMVALYAASMVADHLWRSSAQDGSPDLARSPLADPISGLTAPYRDTDDKDQAALRLEQVAHIFRQLDVMMAINVINAVLVALAIWHDADSWLLLGWLGLIAIGAVGVVRSRLKSRARPSPVKVSKRTLRRISVHSGWRGLAWGAAFALFFADAGVSGKLILGSVSVGMLAGGVLALAPVPSAALLYGLGVMVPTILRLVSFGNGDLVILAMFGITYSGSMMIVAYQLYYNFATNHAAKLAQAEQAATISMLLNEFETSASDWLWETDDAGRLTRLPERMAGLIGIAPGSDSGRPTLAAALRACDGETGAAVRDAMAAGASFRDQIVRVTDGYGGTHSISLSGSPKPDGGYRGVGSNITAKAVAQEERQRALERAEQAEQRLRDGIASFGSGFLLTGSDAASGSPTRASTRSSRQPRSSVANRPSTR